MTTHEMITITNKLTAMTSEIREVRRRQIDLDAKLDRLLAMHEAADTPEGVRTLDDGRVFLPGTGTLGEHRLSPDAAAALALLDEERPT